MKKLEIFELGPLFEEVQMKSLFPDGKTFPDCLPKKDLRQINQAYQHHKDLPDFDLRKFIDENFSYLIDHIGYIPNGNRTYFLGRSQPPFYSLMIQVLREEKGMEILMKYLPELEKEYRFWMSGSEGLDDSNRAIHRVVRMPDGSTMNRYWDEHNTPRPEAYKEDMELSHQSKIKPEDLFRHLRAAAESGWDFSGRWFKDPGSFASIHTTEIVPVDLNCLLFHLEKTISEAMQIAHNATGSGHYAALAQKRKASIQKYCWNEDEKFYFDYDFVQGKLKKLFTLAAAFPLFFELADAHQARGVADQLKAKFLKAGGLTTTLEFTGQQWDAPNGWAPLQWIAYKGLLHYGFDELAKEIKTNWTTANLKVYKKTGKMT